ncbi:HD domain-containing protein [Lachnospiraceae bacterium OttesenSCG-928-J05]|nr:HD domain-containing protein [Lachnospiraceae bacterium OttesenSCG-928-J05]
MKIVNQVLEHPLYQRAYKELQEAEQDRQYCKHDLGHFLDVARLAYIMKLEEGLALDKETIYLAALLHDIGRARQYLEGIPHEEASALIAAEILRDLEVEDRQIAEILGAIGGHRASKEEKDGSLGGILYRADKKSRACYACVAAATCNWPEDKKNNKLEA